MFACMCACVRMCVCSHKPWLLQKPNVCWQVPWLLGTERTELDISRQLWCVSYRQQVIAKINDRPCQDAPRQAIESVQRDRVDKRYL